MPIYIYINANTHKHRADTGAQGPLQAEFLTIIVVELAVHPVVALEDHILERLPHAIGHGHGRLSTSCLPHFCVYPPDQYYTEKTGIYAHEQDEILEKIKDQYWKLLYPDHPLIGEQCSEFGI